MGFNNKCEYRSTFSMNITMGFTNKWKFNLIRKKAKWKWFYSWIEILAFKINVNMGFTNECKCGRHSIPWIITSCKQDLLLIWCLFLYKHLSMKLSSKWQYLQYMTECKINLGQYLQSIVCLLCIGVHLERNPSDWG